MRTGKVFCFSLLALTLPLTGCYIYTTDPPPPAVIVVPAGTYPPVVNQPQQPVPAVPPAPSGPPSGYVGPPR
ncbi:MAG: hypothetical protein BWK76_09460 [Desulfobulbaceae bacterium A2]|nr:MAG: hypothetical protein BWK76_09460 [Desulfobulbaceae bacterium A2]